MVSPCYFHCNCNLSFVIFIVIISLHLSYALFTKSSPPLASWEWLFHHTLTPLPGRGQREEILLNVFSLLKNHLEIKTEFIQTTASELVSSVLGLKYNSEMRFEHFLGVVKTNSFRFPLIDRMESFYMFRNEFILFMWTQNVSLIVWMKINTSHIM